MKEYLLPPELEAKLEEDRADSIKELRDGGAKYTSEGNSYGNRSRLEVGTDQILEAKKLMRLGELEKEQMESKSYKTYRDLPREKQRVCHLLTSAMSLSETAKKMEEGSDNRKDIEDEIAQMQLDARYIILDSEKSKRQDGFDANVVGGVIGKTELEMRRLEVMAEKNMLYKLAKHVLKNERRIESFKNSDIYEKLQNLIDLPLSPEEKPEDEKLSDVREKIAANM